jgi:carboxyl-terminal processing protease
MSVRGEGRAEARRFSGPQARKPGEDKIMRRRGLWVGLIAGLLIGLTIGALPSRSSGDERDVLIEEFFRPLIWLVHQIDENYVEEVDREELLVGAYQGMLASLDRYCVYWSAEMLQEFEADLAGEFGGLGIQITFDAIRKVVVVEQPIAGTPAFKQGILPGDLIIEAKEEPDGELVKTEDFDTVHDAVSVLRGEPGSKVTVTVVHGEGGQREKITITREIIKVPGVRAVEMIDPDNRIGYIYIPYFSKPMVSDLKQAVSDLQEQGACGLVLDMRLNPGGLLGAAEECVDLFLKGGRIVSVRGRTDMEEIHMARRRATFGEMPLVVLVNRYSASGAEIVAAALRDHGRAKVVGEKTFGKASVQTVIENPTIEGTAIKLTIARYYTPNGELIEEDGVAPTPGCEVELSEQMTRELAKHLSRKTAYPPPQGEEPEEEADQGEAAEDETEPFVDKQLELALQVMAEALAHQEGAAALGAHAAMAGAEG